MVENLGCLRGSWWGTCVNEVDQVKQGVKVNFSVSWTEAWSVVGCWEKGHTDLGAWKQQPSVLAEGGVQSESSFCQYPRPWWHPVGMAFILAIHYLLSKKASVKTFAWVEKCGIYYAKITARSEWKLVFYSNYWCFSTLKIPFMFVENQSCACDRVSEVSFFIVLHQSENRPLGHGNLFLKGLQRAMCLYVWMKSSKDSSFIHFICQERRNNNPCLAWWKFTFIYIYRIEWVSRHSSIFVCIVVLLCCSLSELWNTGSS